MFVPKIYYIYNKKAVIKQLTKAIILKENELYIWEQLKIVEIEELKAHGEVSLSDFNSKSNSKQETTKAENSRTMETTKTTTENTKARASSSSFSHSQ